MCVREMVAGLRSTAKVIDKRQTMPDRGLFYKVPSQKSGLDAAPRILTYRLGSFGLRRQPSRACSSSIVTKAGCSHFMTSAVRKPYGQLKCD